MLSTAMRYECSATLSTWGTPWRIQPVRFVSFKSNRRWEKASREEEGVGWDRFGERSEGVEWGRFGERSEGVEEWERFGETRVEDGGEWRRRWVI